MGKVFSGIYQASIYNPADGVTVQVGDISVENSTLTFEQITNDSTQSTVFGGETVTMNLSFFDDAGFATLKAWEEAGTELRAVAAGPTNIQWYESVPITVQKSLRADKRTGLNYFTVMMVFEGATSAIYANKNLMAFLGDVDSGSFQFPVSTTNLLLSVNSLSSSGSIVITLNNYAGSQVSTASTSVNGTGLFTVTDLIESTVYNVVFSMPQDTVEFPALSTNGALTNGTSFMSY
jgi:hypothetical protein